MSNQDLVLAPEVLDFMDAARYDELVETVKRGMPIDEVDDIEFLWVYKNETPEILEMVYG